jgi:phosphonopyruvate decarboxylase
MIRQQDLMAVLNQYRGDAVVLTAESAGSNWEGVSSLAERDIHVSGAMGKAASFALGVALARPKVKVIVLDADGSLLMNLGCLVTIAGQAPRNFCHFTLENGVYATTGGQPIPNQQGVSLATMARGAGYRAAYEFDDLEEFTSRAAEILSEPGPVFVTIKTDPDPENSPISKRPPRRRNMRQQADDLIASLQGGS